MNNKDFIAQLAAETGYTQATMQRLVTAVVDALGDTLQEGQSVTVTDFGTFEVKKKMERVVVNPTTQKRMLVPPKLLPAFKASGAWREELKAPNTAVRSRELSPDNNKYKILNRETIIPNEKLKIEGSDADRIIRTMFGIIHDELAEGNDVKVKGLGTFRLTAVEPRERYNVYTGAPEMASGYLRPTFLPDATLKELVNRPFSQFETVTLNDGVDFKDEEEETEGKETEEQTSTGIQSIEMPLSETMIDNASLSSEEEKTETSPSGDNEGDSPSPIVSLPAVEDVTATSSPQDEETEEYSPKQVAMIDIVDDDEEEDNDEESAEEGDQPSGDGRKLLLNAAMWIAVIAASAFIGYLYGANEALVNRYVCGIFGKQQTISTKLSAPMKQVVAQHPTVSKAMPDTTSTVAHNDSTKKNEPSTVNEKAAKEREVATISRQKYDSDPRVRTGAYNIIGVETTVTVSKGETVASISKRMLGPGMECYVEAFNNITESSELKAGTKLKIPKLELKKRKRN